jgi:upstream activation factor subunit UAF30
MAKTATKKAAPKNKVAAKPVKKAAVKPVKKAAAKPVKKAAAKPVKKAAAPKKKAAARKPNAAFMKPVTPSETLAAVVGPKPVPRTEITKKLWAYIKKNDLQDKTNRRQINADAALKAVFGGKASVDMFSMTKLVGKHLT